MKPPPIPSSRKTSLLFLVLGLPFLAGGIALLVAAPLGFIKERAFLAHAEHTTGTVDSFNTETRYERVQGSSSRRTYYKPVYTFTDSAGRKHTAASLDETRDGPAYKVGQRVPVLYEPNDPEKSQLDTFSSSWSAPLWEAVVGVALTAACLWLAIGCIRGLHLKTDPAANVPRDPAILSDS